MEKDVLDEVTPDTDSRNAYDLSHFSFQVGVIGHLQTVSCIPVVAGDTFHLDMDAVFRLSPLVRPMVMDAMIDLFAFFVPHRHIYGVTNWTGFISGGFDEAITLGTDTLVPNLSSAGYKGAAGQAMPRWVTRGPVLIWNNYFRDPSGTGSLAAKAVTALATAGLGGIEAAYGFACCHPKRIWNSGIEETIVDDDRKVTLTDTNTKFSLLDMAAKQARLKTELKRDYFSAATRYRDVMKHTWSAYVDYNVDERPELIARKNQWLSGYDVEGTDAVKLGQVVGRAVSLVKFGFPPKFFAEHGTLWIMALVRFPPVHPSEVHYLVKKAEPTYAEMAGDPDIIRGIAPIDVTITELFHANSDTSSLGKLPYAQWYREQCSFVHSDHVAAQGWPFVDTVIVDRPGAVAIVYTDYDDIFQSQQLRHWQIQSRLNIMAKRFIPDPRESIFAGTDKN